MTRSNKNPLAPASLATGGAKGADAKAGSPCGAQDNAQAMAAHYLAGAAVAAAQAQLDLFALITDDPTPRIVEAADLLDAVADRLTPIAHFAGPKKGVARGEGA